MIKTCIVKVHEWNQALCDVGIGDEKVLQKNNVKIPRNNDETLLGVTFIKTPCTRSCVLGIESRVSKTYSGILIGSRISAIEFCHLQCPWMTPTQISRTRYNYSDVEYFTVTMLSIEWWRIVTPERHDNFQRPIGLTRKIMARNRATRPICAYNLSNCVILVTFNDP